MEMDLIRGLRREEQIVLELRDLYERYGFRKYRMGKFEEYDVYMENKNFLRNPNIITFRDLDGRLLALKPDVTLSIAKNTHATAQSSERVYYQENVYWLEKQSGCREIGQLGLEYIGRLDAMSSCEVLILAQKTLDAIGERHMMQLSHIGFWVSLLDGLGIGETLRQALLECVHGKRLHELRELLEGASVPPAAAELVVKAAGLNGDLRETLSEARRVAISGGMTEALDELEAVYGLLEQAGCADGLKLDFSLVNDSDYYDGLIFQGFVEGVPRALLNGGYYGRLLRKFGRELDAIGFAVYLNELDLLFRGQRPTDVDALILYDGSTDFNSLMNAANTLRAAGTRVRLERSKPDNIRCGAVYRFSADGLKEADGNA